MRQPSATDTSAVSAKQVSRTRGPGWLAPARRWTLVVLAGLLGAWAAVAIAGTSHTEIGPLSVDSRIVPAVQGETTVRVDPLGTLILDTHDAPLDLRLDLRAVDVEAVRMILDNPAALTALETQLATDLRDAVVEAAIRFAGVALVGAAVGGFLALRSTRRALLSTGVAAAVVALSFSSAALTFDANAIREPRYTGLLTGAPQLLGSAEAIAANFEAYAAELATLVTNVTRVYDATLSLPTFQPNNDTIRVLHVSDLHLNPAAWDVVRAIAEQYDVNVIVDTGDIVDHGTAAESPYAENIATLDRPYVYVKGNHDSVITQAAVANQPNSVVLTDAPVEVAGLRFFGAPDPRFTADKTTRGTTDEGLREATEELADAAEELDPPADVLAFHDPAHAELLDGVAPLLLSGHLHNRQTVVLEEGTRVFVQGSTGAAGLRGLQGEEPTPVMMSVLYFSPETKDLVAWDDITLGGLGMASAEIQRHVVDDDGSTADGSGEPAGGPSGAPSGDPSRAPDPAGTS